MSDKVDCSERLKTALSMRGMTQADLCRATGIPTSAMSQYCKGTLVPRQKRTQVIADALSVSVAWLMGFDVPSEKETEAAREMIEQGILVEPPISRDDIPSEDGSDVLSSEAAELLRIFECLNVKGRTRLLSLAFELEAEERGK